jgi:hypothetical protein
LESTISRYSIPPERIYNIDETGINIGQHRSSKLVIDAGIKSVFRKELGNQEWASVIECINADGTAIKPLVVFIAGQMDRSWMNSVDNAGWIWATSEKGWSNWRIGLDWLHRCFDPQTRPQDPSKEQLLICDGHESHVYSKFVTYSRENNIILLLLLTCPHFFRNTASRRWYFNPLKACYSEYYGQLLSTGVCRMQKAEMVDATCAQGGMRSRPAMSKELLESIL